MFWAVKANKQTILNRADPDEVLASIPDPNCKACERSQNTVLLASTQAVYKPPHSTVWKRETEHSVRDHSSTST